MYGAPLTGHTFCVRHGCQFRDRRCLSQALEGTPYCRRHGCAVQGCPNEANAHGKRLCVEHYQDRQELALAARRPQLPPAVTPGMYPPRMALPGYGSDPSFGMGGGYGYGAATGVPGGGIMWPGMGRPCQDRMEYRF